MSRRSDVDRSADTAIVAASRRARSLLTRLRTQSIGDLIGESRPADRPSRADRPARAA